MDLYSETLLEHYYNPSHAGRLAHPTVHHVSKNPVCGDTITIDIALSKNNKISDVAFTGTGCALSQAGMSLLADAIVGKTIASVKKMDHSDMDALIGTRVSLGRRTCADLGLVGVRQALVDFLKNTSKRKKI